MEQTWRASPRGVQTTITMRPLVRVILNLFMRRLMQNVGADGQANTKHRLLLRLDEFTSIGKLEIFERSLGQMVGPGQNPGGRAHPATDRFQRFQAITRCRLGTAKH